VWEENGLWPGVRAVCPGAPVSAVCPPT
jgi:hypothetical protein